MAPQKRLIVDGKLPCSKCGDWKPVECFAKTPNTYSGRRSRCRDCEGYVQPRGTFGRRPIKPVDGNLQCRKCGEWKPLDRFQKNKASAFGRTRRCNNCAVEKTESFDSRNIKNFLRYVVRALRNTRGQRTKRRAATFSIEMLNADRLLAIYDAQAGLCAVTGIVLTHERCNGITWTNASVDRIDSSKGYEPGNVRLVCRAVNIMRSTMSDTELARWCSLILTGPKTIPG